MYKVPMYKEFRLKVWNRIETLLEEANLIEHLIITGFLEEKELAKWMKYSSVLVINKPSSFQNKYNFPTKLGDYLLSGRPVISATKGMEMNNFLLHGKNCMEAEPNNLEAIAEAIIQLVLNSDLADEIGLNGRKSALESFDFRVHAERLSKFIDRI